MENPEKSFYFTNSVGSREAYKYVKYLKSFSFPPSSARCIVYVLYFFLFLICGCPCTRYELGEHTYRCECTALIPCASRDFTTGECLEDITGWTIQALTCADNDAQAEINARYDCLATLDREHSGGYLYELYRGQWDCEVNSVTLRDRNFCELTDDSRSGWDRDALLASRTPAATFAHNVIQNNTSYRLSYFK